MDDFLADGLMPSVWELSNDEIENDVTVEQVGEENEGCPVSSRVYLCQPLDR